MDMRKLLKMARKDLHAQRHEAGQRRGDDPTRPPKLSVNKKYSILKLIFVASQMKNRKIVEMRRETEKMEIVEMCKLGCLLVSMVE